MDPYRFFHPHHNPRLRRRKLRQQEVFELELAAKELFRATRRALVRTEAGESTFLRKLLTESEQSLELATKHFQELIDLLPEDSESDMRELLEERNNAPGWEAWCSLVKHRLQTPHGNATQPADNEEAQSPTQEQENPGPLFSHIKILGNSN